MYEAFQRESNMIEGIHRHPTPLEVEALQKFAELTTIKIDDLVDYVKVCQPGARLRTEKGMDVAVGRHIAPYGGLQIPVRLHTIIDNALQGITPYEVYCQYEHLHPFTDGNGRSGRALWLWCMLNREYVPQAVRSRGFLQNFHYQALEYWDRQ